MITGAVLPAAAVAGILIVVALVGRSRSFAALATGGATFGAFGGGLALSGLFAVTVTILLPGLVHQHGFDSLLAMVGLAGGLFLLAVVIGPAFARSGAATLPGFVGMRFGRVAQAVTLLVALVATGGLLLANLSLGAALAASLLNAPIGSVAIAAIVAILLLVLPGGMKSVLGASSIGAALAACLLIGSLALVSIGLLGNPVPQIAYGEAIKQIGPAELDLIENGAVDFGVFKPFLRRFLTVDRLNWALLTLSLMGAVAALPPLIQATGAFQPSSARRGLAWSLSLVVIGLTAVPALAAFARLETYRAVSSTASFKDLPQWMRRASEIDAVRLYGTSLGLVRSVERDVAAGATSVDAVSAAMGDRGTRSEATWQRLDPAVQAAVFELARKFRSTPGATPGDRWVAFVDTVVTAASAAAGSVTEKPALASISLDPPQLLLALPHAAGLPPAVSNVAVAIVISAIVVLAAALVASLATMLIHDGIGAFAGRTLSNGTEVALTRLAAVVLTVAGTFAAALVSMPPDTVLVASLSLASGGLFPALLLAIWSPRATAWGYTAALIAGLLVGAYYFAGTAIYSVPFYETWAQFSSNGPEAYAEYEEARELWVAAEGDERTAAFADLSARTTGSLWSPGLANWFGIAPAASPVIAIPIALVIGMLISLVSGPPRQRSLDAFDRIHGRAVDPP